MFFTRRIPLFNRNNACHFSALCVLLCIATVIPYRQVKDHSFLVSYDDELYVIDNPHVLSGLTLRGVGWAFTTFETGNWHPVTWLSHMLDCRLFGQSPRAHHLISLFYHVVNVLLLFYLLFAMTGSLFRSCFVAALFALHPMHVESVAWVSERKDMLSTMFWFCAVICYIRYVKRPAFVRFFGTVLCFVLGLMAKPMPITLPFVLLLLDFWPLKRFEPGTWKKLILEKTPLFAISIASGVVAFIAQSNKNAVAAMSSLPLWERIANAIHSYGAYLWKMVAPVNLAAFYPYPSTPPFAEVFCSGRHGGDNVSRVLETSAHAVSCGGMAVVYRHPGPGYRACASRVAGNGRQVYLCPVCRYLYHDRMGSAAAHGRVAISKTGFVYRITAVLLLLMAQTKVQAGYWKNSVTLFSHAAMVTKNNDVAFLNLGVALAAQARVDEAIASFKQALAARPNDAGVQYDVFNNLGAALNRQGKTDEAISFYRKALCIAPDLSEAHFNLAAALARQGKADEAIGQFKEGLAKSPGDFKACESLGRLLADQGKVDEAIGCFEKALALRPGSYLAHVNLGVALAMRGAHDRADLHFREAIRINPKSAEAHAYLAHSLGSKADIPSAIAQYDTALGIDPSSVDTRMNYGTLLAGAGMLPEAAVQFREALRLRPDYAEAKKNLEVVERALHSGKIK